ncbi:MAG TPA: response regulator [Gemmatimonadales bacterium]|nr:response regulator [Gemmatimonadales bacterium]
MVDDEPAVRALVARALEAHGHMVRLAAHGAEALGLCTTAPAAFDCVITDVRMPVMDGWELGRKLRERWPNLPILYISAFDTEISDRRQRASRASGFLQKPFDREELLQRVMDLIERATRQDM